ncbi:hypothetical protein ACFQZ4_46810 [Catellatospora coxensis]|uniref:Uncharacterized protein n=1 Tax=Catellatospora coxensis TaxID=310354 RepID=A0A8J3L0Q4_9ACTN|nr:hypothetical protein [Catellatospora coxensis]GIG06501.1 hypothetical protein Cco03nite_32010 [Catellatospora coxensis]
MQPTESARRQLAAATFLMSEHQPAGRSLCTCGRLLPCTVALASTRAHEHNSTVLALLHATTELPMVPAR